MLQHKACLTDMRVAQDEKVQEQGDPEEQQPLLCGKSEEKLLISVRGNG